MMPSRERELTGAGDYRVGYGKPPMHTRFRKGQSGNPRGRPRNSQIERARRIVLEEAYRKVSVRDGDKVVEMPAIQAVMRSHLRDALKGNGPNQRAVLSLIQELESVQAESRLDNEHTSQHNPSSDIDRARRIAFVLNSAARGMRDQPVET